MALWSHRCLLQPLFLPLWASCSLPVKFRWIWRGLCTGWSWGCPGCIQGLPEASSSSSVVGSGGGLAWGSEPAPPTSNLTGALRGPVTSCLSVGNILPIWLPTSPCPALAAQAPAGGFALTPQGLPSCPPCLSSGLSPPSAPLQAFYYPEEAGLAFGGPGSSRFLRLEVHYHNPLVIRGKEAPDTPPFLPASDPPSGARGLAMSQQGSPAGRAQPEPSP